MRCTLTDILTRYRERDDMFNNFASITYTMVTFSGPDPTRSTQILTRPDPAQSFYAVPKSKNCNAIFNRLITNFQQL